MHLPDVSEAVGLDPGATSEPIPDDQSIGTPPYQRPGGLGLALQIMFALWVLVAAALLAWSLALHDFVGGLLRSPLGVDVEALEAALRRANAITIVELVSSVITGGVFIAWTRRVYSNLPALGARGLKHSRGWAVGGWFVPFLNLVRPKQIIDATFQVTHPNHTLEAGDAWRHISVSPLVHWWWGLFIAMRVLPAAFDAGAAPSMNALRTQALAMAAASALEMAAAVIAFLLVTRITTNQINRHNRMVVFAPSEDRPIRDPRWGMRPVGAWMAGLAAAALVLGAVTYSTGNLDGSVGEGTAGRDASGAISMAGGMLIEDLRIGDCFNQPDGTGSLVAVEALPCESPHGNEVFSIFQLPSDRSVDYPGDAQIQIDAGGQCLQNMAAYVGTGFRESGLDIFTFFPSEETWGLGDRRVVCSAYDLGLGRLSTSLRDGGGVIPDGSATLWSLSAGDCFDESDDFLIPLVPCSGPHYGSLFDTFDIDSPVRPLNINADVDRWCLERAEATFTSLELAGLDIFALRWPNLATWEGADREVACVALDVTAAS